MLEDAVGLKLVHLANIPNLPQLVQPWPVLPTHRTSFWLPCLMVMSM